MVGGGTVFSPNDPGPHFTVSYGLHQRLAYIRSSPITLPEHDDFMKLTLSEGVRAAQGRAPTRDTIEKKLRIPSVASMFRVDSINTTIARNKNGESEQLIILATSADISTRELAKAVEIRLLPKRHVSEAEKAVEGETAEDEPAEADAETNQQTDETSANEENEDERRKFRQPPGFPFSLFRPQLLLHGIQDAVDEGHGLFPAIGSRQLQSFVDDDARRRLAVRQGVDCCGSFRAATGRRARGVVRRRRRENASS